MRAAIGGMVRPVDGLFVMNKKNTPAQAVVTVLAIVWYVLEIVIKTVQLLR